MEEEPTESTELNEIPIATSAKTEKKVLECINEKVGNDWKNLKSAQGVLDDYKDRLDKLTNMLRATSLDGSHPNGKEVANKFQTILQKQQDKCDALNSAMFKLQKFQKKIQDQVQILQQATKSVEPDVKKIKLLEKVLQYMDILKDALETSESMKLALDEGDDDKLVILYLHLYEDELDTEHSIVGSLKNIKGSSLLKMYVTSLAQFWFDILHSHFQKKFQVVLNEMKWGFMDDYDHDSFDKDLLEEAKLIAEYLFLLKLPESKSDKYVKIGPIVCRAVSAVTKCLLAPFKERFLYHFVGKRPTNRLDKPEWYFIQLLKWSKSNHVFIEKTFQNAVLKAGKIDYNIGLDFIQGLVQLAMQKLILDIGSICMDENTFAHLIDEILLFEVELQENLGYPSSCPSAINVLTQGVYLKKWIALERQFCNIRLNDILTAKEAYTFLYPNPCDDEMKVPKCADHFLRLLDAVKKRYCVLKEPGHQMQFLLLQNEVIENFSVRLKEIAENKEVKLVTIVNAVYYLTTVLSEWCENVHYLHLQTLSTSLNENGDVNIVFDKPLNELKKWIPELIQELSDNIFEDIINNINAYRDEYWSSMSADIPKILLSITPSFGIVLQTVNTKVFALQNELARQLYNDTLRLVARKLDNYMLRNVVLCVTFSAGGVVQFTYDMNNYLFVAFNKNIVRANVLFPKMHDVTRLLSLDKSAAEIVLKKLKGDCSSGEKASVLQKLSILNLGPIISMKVLERRRDLNLYRFL